MATFCIADTVVVAPATADIPALTVKLTVLVVVASVRYASTTLNVTLAIEYMVVGVPLTTPVLLLIVTPAGNVPALT